VDLENPAVKTKGAKQSGIESLTYSVSLTIQEIFQQLNVLVWLFVRRQMAALLKEDELCSGDGMRQSPGCERSHVHVIAAVDHQRGKLKSAKL
jgi:hypothetical protein